MTLRLVPMHRDPAFAYIRRVHRHHPAPQGYKFAIAVSDEDGAVHGVAVAGRPVAKALQDGHTIEVTRVATDGTANACSMLYGACWRAARALGYTRAVTYIQAGETGASLRASGWRLVAELDARSGWDTPSRPRDAAETDGVGRQRWEVQAQGYSSAPTVAIESDPADDGQLTLDLGA